MRKELDKLSRGVACLSLRDVRGHRNSRSAHLRDDPEFLLARERLSHLIDLLCKCHTLLPNLKVLVIPNHLGRRVCPFFTHHLPLTPDPYSYLSATMGSIRAARRAGTKAAIRPTARSATATAR